MKILVLQGSFRKDKGLTERVTDKFLEGVSQTRQDATVKKIYIADNNIENCRGCMNCWFKTVGICSIDDDMKEIMEAFVESDIVIAATPMYMDNMSSHMKRVWERFFPLLSPYFKMGSYKVVHELKPMKRKGLFLISTGAFPEIKQFDSIILSFERIAYNFHMEYMGQLLRPESHSLDCSRRYGETIGHVMDSIKNCGQELGTNLRISDEGLNGAQSPIMESSEDFIRHNNAMWKRLIGK